VNEAYCEELSASTLQRRSKRLSASIVLRARGAAGIDAPLHGRRRIEEMQKRYLIGLALLFFLIGVLIPCLPTRPANAQQGTVPKKDLVQLYNGTFTSSPTSKTLKVGDSTVIIAYLTVTAASGASPTLNVKFQDSSDNGTTWWDIAGTTFTQATGATTQVVVATRGFAGEIQPVITIGGTTPSFTFHLELLTY
jgi:hypothetical protein